MEYPKIETLYERDPQTFKVILDRLRLPEFDLVKRWLVTEKIDGTNVRIILNCNTSYGMGQTVHVPVVSYRGRTDDAQMPPFLLSMLQERFPLSLVASVFDEGTEAIIFGEGYGPKIQKGGGNYRKNVGFRVFDVVVFGINGRPWWLNWTGVEDVAAKVGAETVPVLARYVTLDSAVAFLASPSATTGQDGGQENSVQEGIVARTDPLLFIRNGERLMWKLKGKDF